MSGKMKCPVKISDGDYGGGWRSWQTLMFVETLIFSIFSNLFIFHLQCKATWDQRLAAGRVNPMVMVCWCRLNTPSLRRSSAAFSMMHDTYVSRAGWCSFCSVPPDADNRWTWTRSPRSFSRCSRTLLEVLMLSTGTSLKSGFKFFWINATNQNKMCLKRRLFFFFIALSFRTVFCWIIVRVRQCVHGL